MIAAIVKHDMIHVLFFDASAFMFLDAVGCNVYPLTPPHEEDWIPKWAAGYANFVKADHAIDFIGTYSPWVTGGITIVSSDYDAPVFTMVPYVKPDLEPDPFEEAVNEVIIQWRNADKDLIDPQGSIGRALDGLLKIWEGGDDEDEDPDDPEITN